MLASLPNHHLVTDTHKTVLLRLLDFSEVDGAALGGHKPTLKAQRELVKLGKSELAVPDKEKGPNFNHALYHHPANASWVSPERFADDIMAHFHGGFSSKHGLREFILNSLSNMAACGPEAAKFVNREFDMIHALEFFQWVMERADELDVPEKWTAASRNKWRLGCKVLADWAEHQAQLVRDDVEQGATTIGLFAVSLGDKAGPAQRNPAADLDLTKYPDAVQRLHSFLANLNTALSFAGEQLGVQHEIAIRLKNDPKKMTSLVVSLLQDAYTLRTGAVTLQWMSAVRAVRDAMRSALTNEQIAEQLDKQLPHPLAREMAKSMLQSNGYIFQLHFWTGTLADCVTNYGRSTDRRGSRGTRQTFNSITECFDLFLQQLDDPKFHCEWLDMIGNLKQARSFFEDTDHKGVTGVPFLSLVRMLYTLRAKRKQLPQALVSELDIFDQHMRRFASPVSEDQATRDLTVALKDRARGREAAWAGGIFQRDGKVRTEEALADVQAAEPKVKGKAKKGKGKKGKAKANPKPALPTKHAFVTVPRIEMLQDVCHAFVMGALLHEKDLQEAFVAANMDAGGDEDDATAIKQCTKRFNKGDRLDDDKKEITGGYCICAIGLLARLHKTREVRDEWAQVMLDLVAAVAHGCAHQLFWKFSKVTGDGEDGEDGGRKTTSVTSSVMSETHFAKRCRTLSANVMQASSPDELADIVTHAGVDWAVMGMLCVILASWDAEGKWMPKEAVGDLECLDSVRSGGGGRVASPASTDTMRVFEWYCETFRRVWMEKRQNGKFKKRESPLRDQENFWQSGNRVMIFVGGWFSSLQSLPNKAGAKEAGLQFPRPQRPPITGQLQWAMMSRMFQDGKPFVQQEDEGTECQDLPTQSELRAQHISVLEESMVAMFEGALQSDAIGVIADSTAKEFLTLLFSKTPTRAQKLYSWEMDLANMIRDVERFAGCADAPKRANDKTAGVVRPVAVHSPIREQCQVMLGYIVSRIDDLWRDSANLLFFTHQVSEQLAKVNLEWLQGTLDDDPTRYFAWTDDFESVAWEVVLRPMAVLCTNPAVFCHLFPDLKFQKGRNRQFEYIDSYDQRVLLTLVPEMIAYYIGTVEPLRKELMQRREVINAKSVSNMKKWKQVLADEWGALVKHSRDDGQCYAFLERLEGIMEAMSKVAQACDKLVDHRAIPENGRLNPDETARTLWAVHHQLVLAFMASQDGVGLDYLRWSTNFYLDKRASFTRTIESGGLFPVMNMFLAKQPNGVPRYSLLAELLNQATVKKVSVTLAPCKVMEWALHYAATVTWLDPVCRVYCRTPCLLPLLVDPKFLMAQVVRVDARRVTDVTKLGMRATFPEVEDQLLLVYGRFLRDTTKKVHHLFPDLILFAHFFEQYIWSKVVMNTALYQQFLKRNKTLAVILLGLDAHFHCNEDSMAVALNFATDDVTSPLLTRHVELMALKALRQQRLSGNIAPPSAEPKPSLSPNAKHHPQQDGDGHMDVDEDGDDVSSLAGNPAVSEMGDAAVDETAPEAAPAPQPAASPAPAAPPKPAPRAAVVAASVPPPDEGAGGYVSSGEPGSQEASEHADGEGDSDEEGDDDEEEEEEEEEGSEEGSEEGDGDGDPEASVESSGEEEVGALRQAPRGRQERDDTPTKVHVVFS